MEGCQGRFGIWRKTDLIIGRRDQFRSIKNEFAANVTKSKIGF